MGGRIGCRRHVAALPPRKQQPRHDHDQADLQHQSEQRGKAAHSAEEPVPEQRPNKPAPRNPAARPPSNPPPKKPGRDAVWPTAPALPGCVRVRCIGAAALGAVRVAGGAEKVRMPRLPPRTRRPRGREHRMRPTRPLRQWRRRPAKGALWCPKESKAASWWSPRKSTVRQYVCAGQFVRGHAGATKSRRTGQAYITEISYLLWNGRPSRCLPTL